MMNNISIIEKSLNQKFRKFAKSGKIFLTETNTKNYPKTQIKTQGKILLYSFDTNEKIFPFFDCSEKKLCSINDYVLFAVKENKLFVILCELKSKSNKTMQLHLTEPFIKFILNRIGLVNKVNFDNVVYRKWLISQKSYKIKNSFYDEDNIAYIPVGHDITLKDYLV